MKFGPSPSFLIVSLRYIGDVLVSTALANSIKAAMPEATIDYLVFAGTEGVLAENRLVRKVLTLPTGSKDVRVLARLWKRYDVAIGTNASDRTTFYTAAAGRTSIGFTYFQRKEWWKGLLLTVSRHCDDRMHIVPLILSQLEPLGIPKVPRVVMGYSEEDKVFARRQLGDGYLLLHPYTRRFCKCWTSEGWGELVQLLHEAGLRPIFTRSPVSADREVEEAIRNAAPGAEFFSVPFSMTQLAAAIAGSRAYIGVDTVATHMAAAIGVPTVALYGPTLVRHWGPWPNDWPDVSPYAEERGIQRRGNVVLLQQEWTCVPCNREKCGISDHGRIECLEQLTAEEVFNEVENIIT